MAVQTIPGLSGFTYARVSSMNNRAIGKLTDSNHLSSFMNDAPADYDKKIISLYTQTQLYSNDFIDMLSKSKPFIIENGQDTFKYDIQVPYQFPKIVDIPATTLALLKPGIDGQEFTFVIDSNEFSKNEIVSLGSKQHGPRLYVVKDPLPYNSAYLYTFTLSTESPTVDFVSSFFLKVGTEVQSGDGSIGEFDQDLLGLGKLADKMTMFDSVGAGYGVQHTITSWADGVNMVDENGNAKDIMVYGAQKRGELPITKNDLKWEPFVEYLMRKKMLDMKVNKMIWSKAGTQKSGGSKQEVKHTSNGVYHKIKNNGNYVPYNRGEFSLNLMRTVFGDLFYRRVDIKDRHVKVYTNESGFDTARQAFKNDALNSGITLMANVNAVSEGNTTLASPQNHLTYGFAFDSAVTMETGRIELIHLKELDLPQTNLEFGQNKKSTPVFIVFNVSPLSDGTLANSIREVRLKGQPSMTWGYVDGRRHHLGFAASQGMSSANKFPGYEIWMEDRHDVFIEDLSAAVLIEEIPNF